MGETDGKVNRLNASEVSKALRSGEPVTLKDGGSLSLVVTGKNAGRWVYVGRKAGDRTNIKLTCGYAPETGLSAARAQRDEYKRILKQGINPNAQRRAELAEARRKKQEAEKTFSVVAGEYFKVRTDMTEKTRQGDMGRVTNHIAPFLKDLPITEIRRKDHLKPIIDKLVDREAYTQAKRVAGLIERIFGYPVDDTDKSGDVGLQIRHGVKFSAVSAKKKLLSEPVMPDLPAADRYIEQVPQEPEVNRYHRI